MARQRRSSRRASTEEVAAIVRLAAEHRVPLVPQGGNTSMVGGADASGGRLGADPLAAAYEPAAIDRIRHGRGRGGDDPRRPPRTRRRDGPALPADARRPRELHDRRAHRDQCRRDAGAEVRHDALARARRRSGACRRVDPRRPFGPEEGQSRLQSRPVARRLRGHARRRSRQSLSGWFRPWALARSPGPASPTREQALQLLRFLQSRTDRIEGFEIVPGDSLDLVLQHIPGTRSPLEGRHAWHLLIEATSEAADSDTAPLLQALLGEALEQGLIEDAVIAANEAQADAFWRIRDSLSEAERADGPTLAHDISVPVADMPRFMDGDRGRGRERFPRFEGERIRPSRRRQRPFPRARRSGPRTMPARSRRWSTTW